MNEPFKDRRKYPRIYRNFILHARVKNTDMIHEITQVHDISRGGVCFASTMAFPKGSTLQLELKTPFLNNMILLEGVVIEQSVKVKGMIYYIHVQWVNISADAEDVLNKIEHFSIS